MILKKDYLKNTNLILYQEKEKYHFNSDSCLLGEFIKINRKDSVLDIGCNTGVLLLYASQFKPNKLVGIDLFDEVLEITKLNFIANNVDAKLYKSRIQDFKYDNFDKIICNPPYFHSLNKKVLNENIYIQAARHEVNLQMDELFKSVNRLLKDNGSFYYVHRPFELNRIQENLMNTRLRIKRLQIYYDKNTSKARTICMEIVKGTSTDIQIEEPVYI